MCSTISLVFFFFNDTATTEIYTLSLHDALPIYPRQEECAWCRNNCPGRNDGPSAGTCSDRRPLPPFPTARMESCHRDRKSTRLNSSHANISYAVFCLKKKKYFVLYSNYIILGIS